jgi:serine/threonine protein kinase
MVKMKQLIFETTFSQYTSSGQIIGEGGSARVFKASDESGNLYAVKRLDPRKATSEKRKRFKNELNFCSKNQHSNMITVIDNGIHIEKGDKFPFYVMDLYECSLRTLMDKGIDPAKILIYFTQMIDGVEAAHLQKVIHRDLKPENFLYDRVSDKLLVADFGIARFSEDELYTQVETKPNTRTANFQYAAPEQRSRGTEVDHRADIFALGLILNEMFTREIAHGTGFKTIGIVAPDFEYLDGLVAEMLQQSPSARPSSIEVIKQQLKARGLEFVESQRLSKINQTVIPESDIDDSLIADPPRIVDFDWDGVKLSLIFNQSLNPKWNWALCNMGGYRSVYNKGPDRFKIFGNKATIDASADQVQSIIDYFKLWIPRANQVYEEAIRREKREEEERERQRLKRQAAAQEERLRVLRSVKI